MSSRSALHSGLAIAFGVAAQYLFFRQLTGLNTLIALGPFLALVGFARPPGVAPRRLELWMPAAALALAAACAIRTDQALLVLNVVATVLLGCGTVISFSGVAVGSLPIADVFAQAAALGHSATAGAAATIGSAWSRVGPRPARRLARVAPYVRGVVLAMPLVVVFAGLFSSADAIFARSLTEVFDLRRWREALADLPARTAIAMFAAWVAIGAVAMLGRACGRAAPRTPWALLEIEPATVMLVTIDLLFLGFVGLQIAYLFGGRDTMDAAAITYSSYARRGFFELIAVAIVVAALLFALDLSVRKRGRAYVAAALSLLALTTVVLVSAGYRLDLYQRAYGWSEQRLYAFAVIACLAAAIAILAWSIATDRTAVAFSRMAAAATAVALLLNLLAPSAYVARANLDRSIDPSSLPEDAERALDSSYLVSLGDGAIPVIIDRLPQLPDRERAHLERLLARERFRRDLFHAPDWRGWNLDRELAREALAFR